MQNLLYLIKENINKKNTFSSLYLLILICVVTVSAVGFILILFIKNQSNIQNQQQSAQINKILAQQIAFFIQTRVALLESIAQDPQLAQLFIKRDTIALSAQEAELNYLFPGAARVRLLYVGANQVDEESQPPFGYPALNMLRELEAGQNSNAEVHISAQGRRDVAIARSVINTTDRKILGHILIQAPLAQIIKIIEPIAKDGNAVSLLQVVNQKDVELYKKGEITDTTNAINITGTRWRLIYYTNYQENSEDLLYVVSGLLGAILLMVIIALLLLQNSLVKALNKDLATIITFCKDLRNNRIAANYPLNFVAVNGTLELIQRLFQGLVAPVTNIKQATKAKLAELDLTNNLANEIPTPKPVTPLPTSPAAPPVTTPAPKVINHPPVSAPVVDTQKTVSHSKMENEAAVTPVVPEPIKLLDLPLPEIEDDHKNGLLDLAALDINIATADNVEKININNSTLSEPAAPMTFSGLTFIDSDLSDLAPTNKATLNLSSNASNANNKLVDLNLLDIIALNADADDSALYAPLPAEIFRTYDIRGVVDNSLNENSVYAIGRAIGSLAQEQQQTTVIVGRDGRLSSPKFATALIRGINATGCNVIDIGQVTTPMLYFATNFLDANSGAMITASHNPAHWNGIKIVIGGETIFGEELQKLYKRIENRQFISGEGNLRQLNITKDYLKRIKADIKLMRPLRIAVDCGNGVAGELAPTIYRELGCEVEELFCTVDGNFPNHSPDPTQPQNLTQLINVVKTKQLDLGIAIDGDGDRMIAVNGAGAIIWPDRLMMLFAKDLLSRSPGATIIFDVKTSAHLPKLIKNYGGTPLMWKTGHSLIKAKMKEVGSPLAGEVSGHLFFKERWFGFDDGVYGGVRLLELLSQDQRTPTAVFAEFPESVTTPELRLELPEGESSRLMKSLAVARTRISGAEITNLDGLRADFEEGWGLVRPSNTTPALIFRFEANNQRILRRIQDEFRRIMLEVGPGLKLPF